MINHNERTEQNNNSEYSYHVTLNLNARFQPMHRHNLEDALEKILSGYQLGYVDGGGTMQSVSGEIESCDIELMLKDNSEESLVTLESIIEKLGVAKGSKLLLWNEADEDVLCERPVGNLEGMALYLNGTDLPVEIYQTCDINYVIEQTEALMKGIGAMYSWWEGPQNTALYFYGENYEKMLTAIKNFTEEYPLCQKCVIKQIA